jgi:hypothetical protein
MNIIYKKSLIKFKFQNLHNLINVLKIYNENIYLNIYYIIPKFNEFGKMKVWCS